MVMSVIICLYKEIWEHKDPFFFFAQNYIWKVSSIFWLSQKESHKVLHLSGLNVLCTPKEGHWEIDFIFVGKADIQYGEKCDFGLEF